MSGQHILVIDDSPTLLKVVQAVLTRAGFHVATASDGEEGLQRAASSPPDLILLDFVMPRLNGYQVCRALGESPRLKQVPVVLLSAKGDQIGESFVRVMGISGYVAKPFSPETLLAAVGHALAVPTAVEALPTEAADPEGTFIEGRLDPITPRQLFILLEAARTTGSLVMERGNQAGGSASVAWRSGRVVFMQGSTFSEETLLGRCLVSGKALSREDLELFLQSRSQERSEKPMGEDLVRLGYVSSDDVEQALVRQVRERSAELLGWTAGSFRVVAAPVPQLALSEHRDLHVQALLLVAMHRELSASAAADDIDTIYVPEESLKLDESALSAEELSVFQLVNGSATGKEIARLARLQSDAVMGILARLRDARLIRRRLAPIVA